MEQRQGSAHAESGEYHLLMLLAERGAHRPMLLGNLLQGASRDLGVLSRVNGPGGRCQAACTRYGVSGPCTLRTGGTQRPNPPHAQPQPLRALKRRVIACDGGWVPYRFVPHAHHPYAPETHSVARLHCNP